VGLTVIRNIFVGPSHDLPALLKCGVTMIVATRGELPELVATNEGILPLPLTANPIVGWSFVQVYVATSPVLTVVNVTVVVFSPLHTIWLTGWLPLLSD